VQRKKEHGQLYRFLPQTGSSLVPLSLPRRVSLKCNIKKGEIVGTKGVSENHLLTFDNNKVLKIINWIC